jgi:hypothetical protein
VTIRSDERIRANYEDPKGIGAGIETPVFDKPIWIDFTIAFGAIAAFAAIAYYWF